MLRKEQPISGRRLLQLRKGTFLLLPPPPEKDSTDAIPKLFLATESCLQIQQCHIPPIYKMAKSGATLAVAGMGVVSPPLAAAGTPSQPSSLRVSAPASTPWAVKDSICPSGTWTLFSPLTPCPGPQPMSLQVNRDIQLRTEGLGGEPREGLQFGPSTCCQDTTTTDRPELNKHVLDPCEN